MGWYIISWNKGTLRPFWSFLQKIKLAPLAISSSFNIFRRLSRTYSSGRTTRGFIFIHFGWFTRWRIHFLAAMEYLNPLCRCNLFKRGMGIVGPRLLNFLYVLRKLEGRGLRKCASASTSYSAQSAQPNHSDILFGSYEVSWDLRSSIKKQNFSIAFLCHAGKELSSIWYLMPFMKKGSTCCRSGCHYQLVLASIWFRSVLENPLILGFQQVFSCDGFFFGLNWV